MMTLFGKARKGMNSPSDLGYPVRARWTVTVEIIHDKENQLLPLMSS